MNFCREYIFQKLIKYYLSLTLVCQINEVEGGRVLIIGWAGNFPDV